MHARGGAVHCFDVLSSGSTLSQAVASKEDAIQLATGLLNNAYLIKGTVGRRSAVNADKLVPISVMGPNQDLAMSLLYLSSRIWTPCPPRKLFVWGPPGT